MARPLRIEYPGALYHITSRGNAKRPIFTNHADRLLFLGVLKKVIDRYNWICHAYCLMNNHYHLVVETPEGNVSLGMRQLNGVYTQAYNRGHRRVGHLLQGRYKAIVVEKESHLLEVCRYVVLNPIRAGSVNKPEQWEWSSYRATAGMGKAHGCLTTDWVLEQFGKEKNQAQREYREFVRQGIGQESIHGKVKGQSLLGSEGFVKKLFRYVGEAQEIEEIPRSQRYLNRPGLDRVFNGTHMEKRKRDPKIVEAVERYGYSQKQVADHLGMHYSTISRVLAARLKT